MFLAISILGGDVGRNFEGVLFRLMQPQELEQLRHRLQELALWEREQLPPSSPQQLVWKEGLVTKTHLYYPTFLQSRAIEKSVFFI